MKHILFSLTLILCGSSFSQIWKEPFDTLTYYYDNLEKLSGEKIGIKSYTVSMFDGDNIPVQFDYNEFDEKGNLIKQCMGVSADQELDTMLYFYDETGVFQEAVRSGQNRLYVQRNFFFNEKGRLTSIRHADKMVTAETRFTYNSKNLLDSIIYPFAALTCFYYDKNDMLSKKVIYQNNKIYETFTYSFPAYQSMSYVDRFLNEDGTSRFPSTESTVYYNEFGKVARLEFIDNSDFILHTVVSEYDGDGNVVKLIYEEPTGNVQTNYIRDKKGLLLRVDHVKDGVVYNYSVFEYVYR